MRIPAKRCPKRFLYKDGCLWLNFSQGFKKIYLIQTSRGIGLEPTGWAGGGSLLPAEVGGPDDKSRGLGASESAREAIRYLKTGPLIWVAFLGGNWLVKRLPVCVEGTYGCHGPRNRVSDHGIPQSQLVLRILFP